MPYASTAGTPNVASRPRMTCSGNAEDDDRTNRKRCLATGVAWFPAAARTAWWIVGTAVYHVGWSISRQVKKVAASNPPVQITLPPPNRLANSPAASPWMWNSGMTFKRQSSGPSRSV